MVAERSDSAGMGGIAVAVVLAKPLRATIRAIDERIGCESAG